MNNIPTMLSRDDFQAQHKDMLVSACCEPLSKEEIEARRKCRPVLEFNELFAKWASDISDLWKPADFQIDAQVYQRLHFDETANLIKTEMIPIDEVYK